MALVSAGVRLAPEVPSRAATVQRWHWSREAGEERERLKERGCVKFLFLGSLCKHETSSR